MLEIQKNQSNIDQKISKEKPLLREIDGKQVFEWNEFDLVKNLDNDARRKEIIKYFSDVSDPDIKNHGLYNILSAIVYYSAQRHYPCEITDQKSADLSIDIISNKDMNEKYVSILNEIWHADFQAKYKRSILMELLEQAMTTEPHVFQGILKIIDNRKLI